MVSVSSWVFLFINNLTQSRLGITTVNPILQASEVEETLKRIQSHKGVAGVVVVNSEGIPIKTTMDNTTTVQYAGLISQLSDKVKTAL